MTESVEHENLVKRIIEYIKVNITNDVACFIESDLDDGRPIPEQTPEGFRPDVMFEYHNTLYIGEAKTGMDIARKHSLEQYKSYIKKCQLYTGHATFVLAVPIRSKAEANNIICRIERSYPGDYTIKILGELV